ncbi:MAG: hypothetical protein MUE85_10780 [Microscillaceae bacterium]|jgi:hypothetical protein|nr:hypothetical protein [Microscillaceae bacterium]
MLLKKNPRLEINHYRGLFFNLSLAFVLSLLVMAFELRVEELPNVDISVYKPWEDLQTIDNQSFIEKEVLIKTDLDVK